jgi:pyrimidine-nucleoside phosphorylase
MRAYDIIKKKRDGGSLTKAEIEYFVRGVVRGRVPDYQASALLMAIYFNGMEMRETLALTNAMLSSGGTLDLSGVPGVKVGKHSSGGVGDKVSLILAPLVAAAGVVVPKLSGRGLGHTGGTVDKLASIPGYDVDITPDRFVRILKKTGTAIMGQTDDIAPADKRLYALRDVTATVESVPLIAASIMSKKLAEGLDALVLDVTAGSGALMKTYGDAVTLAETMVLIGKGAGKRVIAVITDMDQPLGRAVGNALEVGEAVDALKGHGPEDLMEVTFELGAWMLVLAGVVKDVGAGKKKLARLINSGAAYEKFVEMVEAQGGDARAVRDFSLLPAAVYKHPVKSSSSGIIIRIDAEAVGVAAMKLGAGRAKADDVIDPAAGIVLCGKVGGRVKKGDVLAVLHTNDSRRLDGSARLIRGAFETGSCAPEGRPLIYGVIQ